MISHYMLFVLYISLPLFSYGYIFVYKRIGLSSKNPFSISMTPPDSQYQDIDLYYNQVISIKLDNMSFESTKIRPIDEGKYYLTPADFKTGATNASRESKYIKDIGPIIVGRHENVYSLSYDENERPKKIIKMYFDFYDDSTNDIEAVLQVNVMPDFKFIPREEVIEYSSLFKGDEVKKYVKETRQGTKLQLICNKTDVIKKVPNRKHLNTETKITYTVANTEKMINSAGESFEMDLTNVVISMDKTYAHQCEYNKLTKFKDFHIDQYKGFTATGVYYIDGLRQGKYIIENENVVSIDVPTHLMYPECLKEFMDPTKRIINTKDFIKGTRLTTITDSIRILDLTRAHIYNSIILRCKYEGGYKTPDLNLHLKTGCNLTDDRYIDKNRISCTIFADLTNKKYTIFKSEEHSVRKVLSAKFYKTSNPESISLSSKFEIIPGKDLDESSITFNEEESKIDITFTKAVQIKVNPIFVLLQDDEEKLQRIVRIYLHTSIAKTKVDDVVDRLIIDKANSPESTFIKINISHPRTSLRCDELFDDDLYTLYPKGKNTVYRNVSNVEQHPSTFEKVQFEDLFGTSGVTILKKPETNNDLEIILDEDYEIIADHFRPIYFICAKPSTYEEFQIKPEEYAVIAIDPIYSGMSYQGCGLNQNLFVNSKEEQEAEEKCEFDLKETEYVRFHCPDYVPEQFIGDGQEKYRADDEFVTKQNPYKSMVRCYDRSTFFSRLLKPRTNVDILYKRKSVAELSSLWRVDKKLMRDQRLTNVICVCYNKEGEPKSHIRIKYKD